MDFQHPTPLARVYIDLTRLCMTPFTTGIQRAAKAIVTRMLQDVRLEIILLRALPSQTAWRIVPHDTFAAFCEGTSPTPFGEGTIQTLHPCDISAAAAFFDIDSAWNMPMQRHWLYPQLKQRGVRIFCHVYDLIPITEPQYFHSNTAVQFWAWAAAVLDYANHIICNAQATADELQTLCKEVNTATPPCTVIPLGGDFAPHTPDFSQADAALLAKLSPQRYLLMVGTIEPRKNHRLLLNAVKPFKELGISVVFAGRIGWNMEQFAREMKKHPLRGKSFFFAESPNDATIHALYENALAVVFPTRNEGFGLPIAEAFCHGTPVLAADLPVLHEVGGSLAQYFDNSSVESLVQAAKRLLEDKSAYAALKTEIAAYRPPTWDTAAKSIADTICAAAPLCGHAADTPLRQLAVLTARNADLLQSLPYWDAYYPFAEEVLVCCPAKNVAELQAKWHGRLHLRFCTDEDLLHGDPLPDDHTKRNFFLRCRMLQYAPLDDVFIMTDDDYRPLFALDETVFRRDGRYLAYYCYDLRLWHGTQGNYTAYDRSMFRTCAFLQQENLPTLQYSSHQPQAIDRRIYLALLDEYPHIMPDGLDEWSLYFNYAVARYPQSVVPMRYCTLGWPAAMTDWPLFVSPKHLYFENFYAILYEKGQVFEHLPTEYNAQSAQRITAEKINRWHTLLRTQHGCDMAMLAADRLYQRCYLRPRELMLTQTDTGTPRFVLPQYTVMLCGKVSRLTLSLCDNVCTMSSRLQYNLQTADGVPLTPPQQIQPDATEPAHPLTLTIAAPHSPVTAMLTLQYINATQTVTGSVPCMVIALPEDTGKEYGC